MPGQQPDRGYGAELHFSAAAVLLEPLLDPILEVGRQQEVGGDGHENHDSRYDSGNKANPGTLHTIDSSLTGRGGRVAEGTRLLSE